MNMQSQYGIDTYQTYNPSNSSYYTQREMVPQPTTYAIPTYQPSSDRPNPPSFRIEDILLRNTPYPGTCGSYSPPHLQTSSTAALMHHHYSPANGIVMPVYRGTHYQEQASAGYGMPEPIHECQNDKDYQGPSSSVLSSLPVYFRLKPSLRTASGRKCRKPRTVFSEVQLLILEREFSEHRYLSTPQRTKLADRLGLNQSQVKTWFQNRRMKWKKETTEKERVEGKLTGEIRHTYSPDETDNEE